MLARLDAIGKEYPDDPLFKTGAVKINLDGVIEAHTAAMLEPYHVVGVEAPSIEARSAGDRSRRSESQRQRLLDARGWQVMTHAVGDRAVRMALDAYAHAARSNPPPERGRRHRIEREKWSMPLSSTSLVGSASSRRCNRPHGTPAARRSTRGRAAVGPERASRGWPYRDLSIRWSARVRQRLADGALNPMLGPALGGDAHDARRTRKAAGSRRSDSRSRAADDAYTSGAAWASFDEQRKGTIAAGMLADLVVMS